MSQRDHIDRQKTFYGSRVHRHLRPREDDFYARKLVARLAAAIGLGPQHRVLEVGAGFGRFTFPLLEHCRSVVALDVSEQALAALERVRVERGIPMERCRTLETNVDAVDPLTLGGPVDFVVGFFFLHHLPDFSTTIARLRRVLAPNGGMAFLEPNRWNPAFAFQVAFCPDMTWAEERGMFRLRGRDVEQAFRAIEFSRIEIDRFGFFPPQVLNRLPLARWLEDRLEGTSILRGLLAFLLLTAR